MKQVRYAVGAMAATPMVFGLAGPAATHPQRPAPAPTSGKVVRLDQARAKHCRGGLRTGVAASGAPFFTTIWYKPVGSGVCIGTVGASAFLVHLTSLQVRVSANESGKSVTLYRHLSRHPDSPHVKYADGVHMVFGAHPLRVTESPFQHGKPTGSFVSSLVPPPPQPAGPRGT